MASRSRDYQVRFLRESGWLAKAEAHIAKHGLCVQLGPFAGMVYPPRVAANRHILPKLAGTYERELHPYFTTNPGYSRIIDIGCAEGYYAVGLARRWGIPVVAYDTDRREREFCRELAMANGVDPLVELRSLCTAAELLTFPAHERILILSDCEGFEQHLFTPDLVRYGQQWCYLIELHGDAGNAVCPLFPDALYAEYLDSADRVAELRDPAQKWLIRPAPWLQNSDTALSIK